MIACVFPGQGSQAVGMGKALADQFEICAATFAEADRALGEPLSDLIFNGPADRLTLTENTQPAILTMSVAAWRLLSSRGLAPAFVAGHSLGEYSAHVAAGSLGFADALALVRRRGELMAEAGRVQSGTMAAILGLEGALVEEACAAVRAQGKGIVVAANFNSPGQVVISGEIAAVEAAMTACKERGAKRAIRLPVSGAFHSPLMGPATEGLRAALADVEVRDAAIPVIANVDAEAVMADLEAEARELEQAKLPYFGMNFEPLPNGRRYHDSAPASTIVRRSDPRLSGGSRAALSRSRCAGDSGSRAWRRRRARNRLRHCGGQSHPPRARCAGGGARRRQRRRFVVLQRGSRRAGHFCLARAGRFCGRARD